MLQVHYPSFDQTIMGGHPDRPQEPFRSHSSYHPPKSSSLSTESRYAGSNTTRLATPSSSTTTTTSSKPSFNKAASPCPSTSSSSSSTVSPSSSAENPVPDSQSTPPSTAESESSKDTPAAHPQKNNTTSPATSSTATLVPGISASAPTTAHSSPSRLRRPSSLHNSPPSLAPTVKLQNLAQILEIANKDAKESAGSAATTPAAEARYDISALPVADIIEMVASLLTKITNTNDRNHDNLQRNIPQETTPSLPPQTSSVLSFHGKNVPSISIHSYLSRIHKYCPTTYEVFISLLVYFDRMTEIVNSGSIPKRSTLGSPTPSGSQSQASSRPSPKASTPTSEDPLNMGNCFVVDSFNIHRLIIAGVTCASKFFSDVFYTNSRYAKVGGLPLQELNHLELQFLLLNDFRLSIPVEDLEAYGTMLVQYYAREKAQTDKMAE